MNLQQFSGVAGRCSGWVYFTFTGLAVGIDFRATYSRPGVYGFLSNLKSQPGLVEHKLKSKRFLK